MSLNYTWVLLPYIWYIFGGPSYLGDQDKSVQCATCSLYAQLFYFLYTKQKMYTMLCTYHLNMLDYDIFYCEI